MQGLVLEWESVSVGVIRSPIDVSAMWGKGGRMLEAQSPGGGICGNDGRIKSSKVLQWKRRGRKGLCGGHCNAGALVRVNSYEQWPGRCVAAWSSGSARHDEVKQETMAEERDCRNGDASKAPLACTEDGSNGSISGLILPPLMTIGKSTNILWQGCMVKREDRQRMLNQKGCVIWITGLSGSGKSTLACTLDHALLQRGKLSYVLDGDNVRHGLNNNLGFSAEDRAENIRRVGEVAKLFADAGVICIASFISPYKRDRDACRKLMAPGDFIEVYMDVALDVCEQRDSKGLYKLARAGKIKGFTGVDDPYESPQEPEIVMKAVNGVYATPQEMTVQMLAYLEDNGFLTGT